MPRDDSAAHEDLQPAAFGDASGGRKEPIEAVDLAGDCSPAL